MIATPPKGVIIPECFRMLIIGLFYSAPRKKSLGTFAFAKRPVDGAEAMEGGGVAAKIAEQLLRRGRRPVELEEFLLYHEKTGFLLTVSWCLDGDFSVPANETEVAAFSRREDKAVG